MAKKSKPFHADEYLGTDEDIEAYIAEAMLTADVDTITRAIGVAAKARGMTAIAAQTGLSRESLYKALSGDGHPQFDTIMKVLKALGLRMNVEEAIAFKTAEMRMRASGSATRMDRIVAAMGVKSKASGASPRGGDSPRSLTADRRPKTRGRGERKTEQGKSRRPS